MDRIELPQDFALFCTFFAQDCLGNSEDTNTSYMQPKTGQSSTAPRFYTFLYFFYQRLYREWWRRKNIGNATWKWTELNCPKILHFSILFSFLYLAMQWFGSRIFNLPGPWLKAGKDNASQTPGLSITSVTYLVSNDQNHYFNFVLKKLVETTDYCPFLLTHLWVRKKCSSQFFLIWGTVNGKSWQLTNNYWIYIFVIEPILKMEKFFNENKRLAIHCIVK